MHVSVKALLHSFLGKHALDCNLNRLLPKIISTSLEGVLVFILTAVRVYSKPTGDFPINELHCLEKKTTLVKFLLNRQL